MVPLSHGTQLLEALDSAPTWASKSPSLLSGRKLFFLLPATNIVIKVGF